MALNHFYTFKMLDVWIVGMLCVCVCVVSGFRDSTLAAMFQRNGPLNCVMALCHKWEVLQVKQQQRMMVISGIYLDFLLFPSSCAESVAWNLYDCNKQDYGGSVNSNGQTSAWGTNLVIASSGFMVIVVLLLYWSCNVMERGPNKVRSQRSHLWTINTLICILDFQRHWGSQDSQLRFTA